MVSNRDFLPRKAYELLSRDLYQWMTSHMQPVTEEDCESLGINDFADFLNIICPFNHDFKSLVMERQTDYEQCEQ